MSHTNMISFTPLHDRVLIRRTDKATKIGHIIIPDTNQEKPTEGEVIAVGKGLVDVKGMLTPTTVKPGDLVLFGKWSGTEVKINNENLIIMKETDILGIVKTGKKENG